MNIEKALKLTKSKDLLAAAKEAEQRNVENHIIRQLYKLYYKALDRESRG